MNPFELVVKELTRYIKSHLMDERRTQIALDISMNRLRRYGTKAVYIDHSRTMQFSRDFMLDIEAILLGVYGSPH